MSFPIERTAFAQTDHGGGNVTWADQQVSGIHYNIGTLNINGNVTVADEVALVVTAATINVNGLLSADGKGYDPAEGTTGDGAAGGNNLGAGGGGYGGAGGNGSAAAGGPAWGNPTITNEMQYPDAFGSAGGSAFSSTGGSGGGAIKLVTTGTLKVDGEITADGQHGLTGGDDGSGGGAGGSIWLDCNTLAGGGLITAQGGNGQDAFADGGGGGGGRIALYYSSDVSIITFSVAGGSAGAAATDGEDGTFWVNGALGVPVETNVWDHGGFDWKVVSDRIVSGIHTNIGLLLVSNCTATVEQGTSFWAYASNIVIDASGTIDANGKGTDTRGKGYGNTGGGGYGGAGGAGGQYHAQGGWAYGNPSVTNEIMYPDELGSTGGRGTRGGGAIRLVAADTLDISGNITANGVNGSDSYGAGSGGSIWLDCDTLTGNGSTTAKGGNSTGTGGGGGGGRIAIYYNTNSSSITPSEAMVGGGSSGSVAYAGQAGTFWVNTGLAFDHSCLGYNHGGADWIIASDTYNIGGEHTGVGTFKVDAGVTAGVACGARLFITAKTITIDGTLTAAGKGYFSRGPGSPGDGEVGGDNQPGGGGGYGGAGGDGSTGRAGGVAWGDPDIAAEIESPDEHGGGGGTCDLKGATAVGGPGGGAIRLRARGTLTVEGTITANGLDGWDINDDGNAGGAGGSIWLQARKVLGAGMISATGGDGQATRGGGGGGGGRIAIYYNSPVDTNLTIDVSQGICTGAGGDGEPGTSHIAFKPLSGTVLVIN